MRRAVVRCSWRLGEWEAWCGVEIIFSRLGVAPPSYQALSWTGDVEVRVVGEGIKGFRRVGLAPCATTMCGLEDGEDECFGRVVVG